MLDKAKIEHAIGKTTRIYCGGITYWYNLAGRPGFEPGLTGPEPVVLPLDDPPAVCLQFQYNKAGDLVKPILTSPVFQPKQARQN